MTENQFKRIEALLLLNSFLHYCGGQPPISEPEVWAAVAQNYKSLNEWLDNGNELSKNSFPSSMAWPEEP